jgi:hypothetical protein
MNLIRLKQLYLFYMLNLHNSFNFNNLMYKYMNLKKK